MEACNVNNVIKHVVICLIILPLISSQDLCIPGSTQIFSWNYDVGNFSHAKNSTVWKYNGVVIMNKDAENPAEIVPGEGFDGRLSEDTMSYNAGIIISNIMENDTGLYDVEIIFSSGSPYEESSQLDVIDTSSTAEAEIKENGKIMANSKPIMDINTPQVISNMTTMFEFSITEACIPVHDTNIHIHYNGAEEGHCHGTFTCAKEFGAGSIHVIVDFVPHDLDIRFPDTGYYTITGQEAPPPPQSCADRLECILPATIVPIVGVILIIVVVVVVKKRS